MRKFELITLEYRYLLSGENPLSRDIVLVLNDPTSRSEFGVAPYPRESLARMIEAINRQGARVIGVDFRFEEAKSPRADSLVRAAIDKAGNVVIGYSYPDDFFERAPNGPGDKNRMANCFVADYPYFMYSPTAAQIAPELSASRARLGHIDVLIDTINGYAQSVPLYIDERRHRQALPPHVAKDSACAAFALEIIKAFYGFSNREIKVQNNQLVLMPGGHETIRIPMTASGEYFINHLGYKKSLPRYLSWSDIRRQYWDAVPDSSASHRNLAFKDKIVLIGSLVDEDEFSNAYSKELPGILLHAMVIDNFLREQFLELLPYWFQLTLLGFLGIILWGIFVRFRRFKQLTGAITLLLGYIGVAWLFFYSSRVVLPIVIPAGFIFLAITVRAHQAYISALQTGAGLLGRLNQVRENYELLSTSLGDRVSATAYYRLIIFAIEESEQCMFPHWLDFRATSAQQIPTIVRRPVGLHPVRIEANVVTKLNYSIKNLWQIYYDYVRTGKVDDTKPVDRLREIGSRVAKGFGLNATIQDLLRSEDKTIPLNLIVTKLNVPWPWAYAAESKLFLCEAYAIGTSFAIGKNAAFQPSRIETDQGEGKSSKRMAILFYGDWNGHPGKHLQHVRDQIVSLQSLIIRQDCSTMVIQECCADFLARLAQASVNRENLRFIHYTGHAEDKHLDVGKENFLRPGMISEVMGVSFPSRPLIFLNACSSGQAQEEWDSFDSISTEFLACGAGACIVTSHDVYEKTAGRFALIFYDYFANQKLAAGEALKRTINDLSQPDPKNNYDPDYDITRYFYQLYGDPMVKF